MKKTRLQDQPAPVPAPQDDAIVSLKWGWYLFSVLIPFAGIFVALFLYDQDSREVRRVGRNCLLAGFLVWIVFPVCILIAVMVLTGLAVSGWIADMSPLD